MLLANASAGSGCQWPVVVLLQLAGGSVMSTFFFTIIALVYFCVCVCVSVSAC